MRNGYILRAKGTSSSYFHNCIKSLEIVTDRDYAWFTESLDVASSMIIDLYLRLEIEFMIEKYTHV